MAYAIDSFFILFAACLVFFMQAGFALVEVGFTRAKNAANIIMKNFMDFSVGSIFFLLIGGMLMFGEDVGGVVGSFGTFSTNLDFGDGSSDLAVFFFQTCFAATAVTIVSGAVAGRMKFFSYLLISFIITAFIYPISGHWVWGGGWLSELGFIDFAGSSVVHAVGGFASLAAVIILGPRIGKFNEDGSSNAIAGHSLTLGALGVFILWLGWFGFNPGSNLAISDEASADAVAMIFMTTNLAAAAAAIVAMLITRFRYGKADVGATLNGGLAGLVGVTAGCANVDVWGALVIGLIAGVLVIYGMEFVEKVLKLDDAVGAVSVHGLCGFVGTILVGFLATDGGLLYGGGFELLGVQILGAVAIAAWAFAAGFIIFKTVDVLLGLRVTPEEEEVGLDITEHDASSYPNFVIND